MHAHHSTAPTGLVAQQLTDQRNLEAWIEREAERDIARCGDPYACTKEGDGAYWVQS